MAHDSLKYSAPFGQKVPADGQTVELPGDFEGHWRLNRLRAMRDTLVSLEAAHMRDRAGAKVKSAPSQRSDNLADLIAFPIDIEIERSVPLILFRIQGTDWDFLRNEMNWLISRQRERLGLEPERWHALERHLSSNAISNLRYVLEVALCTAYGIALRNLKPKHLSGRVSSPEEIWRCLINTFPGPLWAYGQEVIDHHYVDWRQEMLKKTPSLALPQTCPISCAMLLRGRFRHWYPHPKLQLYLNEYAKFRERVKQLESDRRQGHYVRLLSDRSADKEGLITGKSLLESKEFGRLRQSLAEPRPLKLAGDVDLAIARLYQRFPWFGEVLTRLRREIIAHANQRHGALKFAPFLLIGPPGIGKTRFMRELATAFDLPFHRVDRGGETDNRDFAGTARGYHSAQVAMPTRVLSRIEVANPLIFIDEIDKESTETRNGSATNTLMAWIEPETAKDWQDPCLAEAIDLSHINWTLGANSLQPIKGPLLSRLHVCEVGGPRPEHFDALLASILQDELERHGGGLGTHNGGPGNMGGGQQAGGRQRAGSGSADNDGLDVTGGDQGDEELEQAGRGRGADGLNNSGGPGLSRKTGAGQSGTAGVDRFSDVHPPLGLHLQVIEALRHQFQRQHLSPRNLARLVNAALAAEIEARVRRRLV